MKTESFLIAGDFSFLASAASGVRRGGTIVEIGSWKGSSAIALARGNESSTVHCCDTWKGSNEEHRQDEEIDNLLDAFRRNVSRAGAAPQIVEHAGDSVATAEGFDGRIDLLFVDGDHGPGGCYRDLAAWVPHVAQGGRVLAHDCLPDSDVMADVIRFCNEHRFAVRVFMPPIAHYMAEILL